jgi:large subunit ribosomal protein L2
MPIKKYRPTSPGRRAQTIVKSNEITKKKPEKSLTVSLNYKAGRSRGKVSVRGRGGRVKRLYRIIDFKRYPKAGIPAKVVAIEYDPNRTANIALLQYNDGEKSYILAPAGLKIGDPIDVGEGAKIKTGNALPVKAIPVGTFVHNLELHEGQGGKLIRSAGQAARVMAKDAGYVHIKLPSGEIRLIPENCYATVGQVGNAEQSQMVLGKAGRKRYKGFRPSVRGVAMPAGEHPHGGGEGRTGTGGSPRTPWGKIARGVRTRKKDKASNKYIVKSKRQK